MDATVWSPAGIVNPVVRVGVCAVTGVLPVFLFGAMAALIATDLAFGAQGIGLASGGFFVATALTSTVAGRVTDWIGNDRAMHAAVVVGTASVMGVVVLARSWWQLTLFLALGGFGNAMAQPSTSAAVSRLVPARHHGLAFGVKQLNGPVATLFASLLAGLVAVRLGWRVAFGLSLLLTLPYWLARLRARGTIARAARARSVTTRGGARAGAGLWRLAIAATLGACTATSLGSFYVVSAVSGGVEQARAASLLTVGSVAGMVGRMVWGRVADLPRISHARLLASVMALGGVSTVALGLSPPSGWLVLATVLTFITAWSWPGLLLLAIVRARPDAPAGATGFVLTGVAVGGTVGPPLFGTLVDAASYAVAWTWSGSLLLVASALAVPAVRRASADF